MEETAKKTAAFLSAIQALSEKECAEIDAETESVRKTRLETMEAETKQHYKAYMEYEVARIRAEANRAISQKSEDSRRKLTALRTSLCEAVFDEARGKLLAFRETPQYRELVLKSVRSAAETLAGNGTAEIYICQADEGFADEICSAFGAHCRVQISADIALGGVRVRAGNYLMDDTLDKRLAAQKTWFLENSGLSVEE